MPGLRSTKWWFGLGGAAVALVVALAWLGVNGLGLRFGPQRPAEVPPPSETRPIALWSETEHAVVDLEGEVRLAYEKLPGLERDEATARLVLEVLDQRGAAEPVLQLLVKRPLPEERGRLELGALLAAVNEQQALSPRLAGNAQLVITLGDRDAGQGFQPLSNEVTVPCVFD